VPLTYYVFDILWLDGEDVRSKPLRERKQLLKDTIDFHGPLRFTEHRNEGGVAYFQEACRKGWEGVIAKRADSPYSSKRSKDWLKFKCGHGQELVIGGFTEPRGTRIELGALLLGVYEGDQLRYAGKVGTGFDRETLKELGTQLRARRRDTSPFADEVREKGTTWVEPELVAQIGFAEWTRDGRLRHPRFLGLREDKAARDVTREG
jgi:DNA ligase D-like protein (predicted ligase)